MENKWLENLKPGDKVIIRRSTYGTSSYDFDTVKAITAKRGDIKLNNSDLVFGKTGSNYGTGYGSTYAKLIEPTEENLKAAERAKNLQDVKSILHYLNENRNHHAEVMVEFLDQLKQIRMAVKIAEKVSKEDNLK